MDLCQLSNISWSYLLGGYLYAVIFGNFFIFIVMTQMRALVNDKLPIEYQWQPFITGFIERTLYLVSFLAGKPEFIIAWLIFKVAGGLDFWGKSNRAGTNKGKEGNSSNDDSNEGRRKFSNTFNGNALSILYAFVGYLIAYWHNSRAFIIAFLLLLFNFLVFLFLWKWDKNISKLCGRIINEIHSKFLK